MNVLNRRQLKVFRLNKKQILAMQRQLKDTNRHEQTLVSTKCCKVLPSQVETQVRNLVMSPLQYVQKQELKDKCLENERNNHSK